MRRSTGTPAADAIAETTVDTGLAVDSGAVALEPHRGAELVSAGAVTKSTNDRMVSNLGPTTNQLIRDLPRRQPDDEGIPLPAVRSDRYLG